MTAETVRGILKNETFVGDKLLQKRPPKNFLTHKPDPSVDYDSFYITDGHPAIIDRDTWDQVQKKLSDRKEEQERGIYSEGRAGARNLLDARKKQLSLRQSLLRKLRCSVQEAEFRKRGAYA